MKLSDYRGEDALDVVADLIDPVVEIISDDEIKTMARNKTPMQKLVKPLLKGHKRAVLEILAALERRDPDEYAQEVTVVTLPKKLLEILNDKALLDLFRQQGQMEGAPSGSATESTEDSGK